MVLASLLYIGSVLASCTILLSLWLDLSLTGESVKPDANLAPLLCKQALIYDAQLYIGDADVKLQIWEEMRHIFPAWMSSLPEGQAAFYKQKNKGVTV